MCGFVAGLTREPIDAQRLERSLDALHHRGPDGRGRWISADGRWFLGHTRLSIIGLDNGAQPMSDASGDVRLVVNGEFYGYRAIREQLRAEGHVFATDSDSEIALHLYLRDGMSAARMLRGEFAAVLADRRNQALIALRDRFGIKPLFYAVHAGHVYFASEVKALIALGVPARWNRASVLEEVFHFRPSSHTLFDGIYSVPPGHYAIAQRGEVRLYPYWDLPYPSAEALAAGGRPHDEVIAGFRAALDDAVQQRLVADVEVASYLSGGIDSCAVLGLAQQHMSRPIRAFTLSFDDARYDEAALAQAQAERCGASFHPIAVTTRALADSYSDAVFHAETMFFNGHGVAKFLLSRAVRDAGIKVVFTGEGADEMLGGYPPFRRDVLLYNSGRQDPATVSRLLAELREANKTTPALVNDEGDGPAALQTVRRRLGWVPSWMQSFAGHGQKSADLFRPDFAASLAGVSPYDLALDRLPIDERVRGRDPLNQALYLWSKSPLANFILTLLGDRMEMAHSIEGRVPFLDHHVAEYAAGIPIELKIQGMREKHVLREATRDVLIEPVYNRQKQPFATPPTKVGANDAMLELLGDVFASPLLDAQPIFDPKAVRHVFRTLPERPVEERELLDLQLHRVLSTTLLHQRFAMSS